MSSRITEKLDLLWHEYNSMAQNVLDMRKNSDDDTDAESDSIKERRGQTLYESKQIAQHEYDKYASYFKEHASFFIAYGIQLKANYI